MARQDLPASGKVGRLAAAHAGGYAAGLRLDEVSASGTTCLGEASSSCRADGKAEKGMAFANVSSVHSGFSSSMRAELGSLIAHSLPGWPAALKKAASSSSRNLRAEAVLRSAYQAVAAFASRRAAS